MAGTCGVRVDGSFQLFNWTAHYVKAVCHEISYEYKVIPRA